MHDAEALLVSLYDSSLLRLAGDRFFLLPTAGEYAGVMLGKASAALQRRHAEHYLGALETAATKIRTRDHQKALTVSVTSSRTSGPACTGQPERKNTE